MVRGRCLDDPGEGCNRVGVGVEASQQVVESLHCPVEGARATVHRFSRVARAVGHLEAEHDHVKACNWPGGARGEEDRCVVWQGGSPGAVVDDGRRCEFCLEVGKKRGGGQGGVGVGQGGWGHGEPSDRRVFVQGEIFLPQTRIATPKLTTMFLFFRTQSHPSACSPRPLAPSSSTNAVSRASSPSPAFSSS